MKSKLVSRSKPTIAAAAGLALLGTLSLATACSRDPKPAHLDIAKTPAEVEDDQWIQQQRRLHIKYYDQYGYLTDEKDGGAFEAMGAVYARCMTPVSADTSNNQCFKDYLYGVSFNICAARSALAIATTQSQAITFPYSFTGSQGSMVLDKITEANAAEIAAYGADYARYGVEYALNFLKNPPAECRTAGATGVWTASTETPPRSMAQLFAAGAVEAYYLVRAGYDKAIESTVNVSDSARTSTPSLPQRIGRSTLGAAFSRAAAAHLLVGGDDGILGSTTKGYCSTPPLTPQAKQALDLLRDAAPPPSLVLGTGDIQSLLYATQTEGSVRQRLGSFYGISALGPGLPAGQSVEQYYDLDEKDFVQARDYLKQEIDVFGRSPSAKQAPVGLYSRYAGTGGDVVKALPHGAWSARARYTAGVPRWYNKTIGYWPIAPNGYDSVENNNNQFAPLDTFIGEVHSQIRALVRTATDHYGTTSGTIPTATSKEVLGVLGSVVASNEYKGTVEIISGSTKLAAAGHGFSAAEKLRVVVGEEGLRCAVQGNIEDADCSDALTGAQYASGNAACTTKPGSLSCLTAVVLTGDNPATYFGSTSYTGNSVGRTLPSSAVTALINSKTRVYVVKLKQGATTETPGAFELLGGSTLRGTDDIAIPVVADMDARVARVLAPDRHNCVVSSTSCVGKTLDDRLPLENELTDNGDAVENSWRHYLDLARQAANESDALGKDFQDAKLSKLQGDALTAQRKEEQAQAAANALDEVQTLCGTNLDSRKVLESFSGGPGQNTLDEVTTSASCPNCTGDGSDSCLGGKCYKNLGTFLKTDPNFKSDPDAARLDLCLSDGPTSVDNFVTLGDKPLCVWTRNTWPYDVCPSNIVGQDCPTTSTGSCTTFTGAKTDVAAPLKYYQNSVPPMLGACSMLRKARYSHLPVDAVALQGSMGLHPNRLADRVGKLSFISGYGGHFSILEDGATRWSSGSITDGRLASGWPTTATCTGEKGLFCSAAGTTPATIGPFNARVLKATLAAAAIKSYSAQGQTGDTNGLAVLYPYNPTFGGTIADWMNGPVCSWASAGIGGPPTVVGNTVYRFMTAQPVTVCNDSFDWGQGVGYQWPGGNPTEVAWIHPNGGTYNGDFNFKGPRGSIFCADKCEKNKNFILNPISEKDILGQVYTGMFNGTAGAGGGGFLFLSLMGVKPEGTPLWKLSAGDTAALNMGFGSITEIDVGAALDGLELLCELDGRHGGAGAQVPTLTTLSDIEQAGAYLERTAQTITDRAALTIFANVPKLASDALMDVPPTGAFPALSGQMGEAVAGLRAALVGAKAALPIITSSLQQMGAEMQNLRASLDITDASKQIIDLETQAMTLNQVAACGQAIGSIQTPLSGFGAAVACVNAGAQIAIGMKKSGLQQQIADDGAKQVRAAFAERMSTLALNMQQAAQGLETATEEIGGSLARIDGLRKQAKMSLAKALYMNSYQSQAQVAYDSSVGALADQAQTRYVTALKNAKLMSFYARRAIEQRLGMQLTDMTEDLPLVDAPQKWSDNVCTMGGILTDPSNEGKDWVAVYGEGFIGDYVNKLEAVVESYNLVNNFHEGKDLAVVSLRDDVIGARKVCRVPSANLLVNSGDLTAGAWRPRNCTTTAGVNCMAAFASPVITSGTTKVSDLAVPGLAADQKGAQGYVLRFGDGGTCAGTTGACTWKTGSALSQLVTLTPGRYRFSWYTRDAVVASTSNGASLGIAMVRAAGGTTSPALCPTMGVQPAVCLVNSPDASPASPFVFPQYGSLGTDRWKRASVEFVVNATGSYEIGFGVTQAARPTYETTVGAPMLETVSSDGSSSLLPAYQDTDLQGQALARKCEDTTGDVFRQKSWHRDCVHLCNVGFEGNCNSGPLYCYQELSFGVSQSWLQNGKLFNYSGFAKGNFNYRIDSIGLNFVGSGVRNCESSKLPSTCYNAGFVPYSVAHTGPFYVRNAVGGDFEAKLFEGHIEHARGLGLERYLTNPISSTDRDLMQDYMRGEFAGRPLDGNFTIRVWEEPGVDFNAIQDIQLILNYRYWTAFN